jgi:hypothetical protein
MCAMSPRSRRVARALTLLGLLGAVGAVGIAYRHRFAHEQPPALGTVDGWAARGVRYSHEGRGGARLRVTAEAIAPVPIRWGVFRIGSMERLEARGLDVVIDLGKSPDLDDLESDVREALASMASSKAQGKRFAGGKILGLSVRLQPAELPALEVRAGRCELGSGRIVCRGDVVARVGDTALPFETLAYDLGERSFEVPNGREPRVPAGDSVAARERVSVLNAAFRRLVPLPTPREALHR